MRHKRLGMTRFNKDHVQALREAMAKCPDTIYTLMVDKGAMTDADMIDFALCLANSYFNGSLLKAGQRGRASR